MSIKSKLVLLTLGAVIALMTMPVNAGAVKCSEFGGFIPAGTHNYNIIVDVTCHVEAGAIVNGNLIEPGNTDYSIYVFSSGIVNGNIKEKGPGLVFVDVGGVDQLYVGNIFEKGEGMVKVWVDGVFHGNVMEQDEGDVKIEVFDGCPSAGPGVFIGSTMEKGPGDAYLSVREGECSTEDGYYEGDFTEKGPGICYTKGHTPLELPTVNFNCATLEVGWPNP
jgi:hypothetical protein